MRDERRQYEFNDQQSAVQRNDCAAVPANTNSFRVPIAVQDMFEHIHIGASRDRLGQVCGDQLASGGKIFIRKARFSCIHAGLAVDKHAWQMRVESQHCKNLPAYRLCSASRSAQKTTAGQTDEAPPSAAVCQMESAESVRALSARSRRCWRGRAAGDTEHRHLPGSFAPREQRTYVSKCIGNAEACSRAKRTAAGITMPRPGSPYSRATAVEP